MGDQRYGLFLAFEGIDGCGKSTQAKLLADRLNAILTHEPGATDLGKVLRKQLLNGEDADLTPKTEALLLIADRAQHVHEIIRPQLEAGNTVITDRFSASTIAYQGAGRQIDKVQLRELSHWASGGLEPDLNILIDIDPGEAASRRTSDQDRLESLGISFQDAVSKGFREIANSNPAHWLVIDGMKSITEIANNIYTEVTAKFRDRLI